MSVDISNYSTMKIGGRVANFETIARKSDIIRLTEKSQGSSLPIFILGGGSNTIFRNGEHDLIVAKMGIKGVEVAPSNDNTILITVGAGENWDDIAAWAATENYSGLEALSGIPGTAGAAPIQNIGAYGKEVSEILEHVEVYDKETDEFRVLQNDECKFSYRNSIFKENRERWVITNITLRLKKEEFPSIPSYKDVTEYFSTANSNRRSVRDIRNAILNIRRNKLPDPSEIPNCGSFFKNPIVENGTASKLKQSHPEMPIFDMGGNHTKIPAGWLIDKLGFKGHQIGGARVYDKNSLVLTNTSNASFPELEILIEEIKDAVYKKYGITLEEEVNIVR
jgi:UDP-N-acetylmuramate dehydrogenase